MRLIMNPRNSRFLTSAEDDSVPSSQDRFTLEPVWFIEWSEVKPLSGAEAAAAVGAGREVGANRDIAIRTVTHFPSPAIVGDVYLVDIYSAFEQDDGIVCVFFNTLDEKDDKGMSKKRDVGPRFTFETTVAVNEVVDGIKCSGVVSSSKMKNKSYGTGFVSENEGKIITDYPYGL